MAMYGHKYIVVKDLEDDREYFIMFPAIFNYDVFARQVKRTQSHKDYCNPEPLNLQVVGAGFTDGRHCWGRSETLNCGSRGKDDEKLIHYHRKG